MTGLFSEGCVRATCLGAFRRGYRVVLVADAHSSSHSEAARRVREWNDRLADEVDAVIPAREVDLAGHGTG